MRVRLVLKCSSLPSFVTHFSFRRPETQEAAAWVCGTSDEMHVEIDKSMTGGTCLRKSCTVIYFVDGSLEARIVFGRGVLALLKKTTCPIIASTVMTIDAQALKNQWYQMQPRLFILLKGNGETVSLAGAKVFPLAASTLSSPLSVLDKLVQNNNWLIVVESPSAYDQYIRPACNAPILQCLASMIVEGRHREDLRKTASGVPLFALFPDDSVLPGSAWILVLNPKNHDPRKQWDRCSLQPASSWVAWWIHASFIDEFHGSVAAFEDLISRNAPRGPLAEATERLPILDSNLQKPGGRYLHTVCDLESPDVLLELREKVCNFLYSFFERRDIEIDVSTHYPCGPVFSTLHLHFRIALSDEHEKETRRIIPIPTRDGNLCNYDDPGGGIDQVSLMERQWKKSYRIEDNSGSFRLLVPFSDAPYCVFNGHTMLLGDMNNAHRMHVKSTLKIPVQVRFLVCVCGDSGAGKDTIINAIEKEERYIEFPSIVAKADHLDESVFGTRSRRVRGDPSSECDVTWRVGNVQFGFKAPKAHLSVVNVSRSALECIRESLSDDFSMIVVYVHCPLEVSTQRMNSRLRKSDDIAKRVAQNAESWQPIPFEASDFVFLIDNSRSDAAVRAVSSLKIVLEILKK